LLVSGGRNRSRKKSGRPKAAPTEASRAEPNRPLAWHQFQELNFSFYQEHPSDFINMRIEVLSLMLCNEEQLGSAYAAERSINGIRLGGTTPPNDKQRKRYLQTEAVVILHHAAEMILRLYYAHLDQPDCPWLGMASETSFAQFKAKVEKSLEDGFDRAKLAEIFLGGSSPEDACIAMSAADFEDGLDGLALLLEQCAERLLSESFLYNSIKHGLSTIALDESTEISNRSPDGKPVVAHRGPLLAYMHKARRPGVKSGVGGEWFISLAAATTDRDLALAVLIAKAIESLWDVARRRYTGKSGQIRHIRRVTVETAIYGLLSQSGNILDTITLEMPRLKDDGSPDGVEIDFVLEHLPEDYEVADGVHPTDCPRVNLPTRQKDQRVFSTSKRAFYPFSPKGSQRI
jgi:hypothetical protein